MMRFVRFLYDPGVRFVRFVYDPGYVTANFVPVTLSNSPGVRCR